MSKATIRHMREPPAWIRRAPYTGSGAARTLRRGAAPRAVTRSLKRPGRILQAPSTVKGQSHAEIRDRAVHQGYRQLETGRVAGDLAEVLRRAATARSRSSMGPELRDRRQDLLHL